MRKTIVCLLALCLSGCAAAQRQFNADWPMFQADSARSGSVEDAARPPLKLKWSFTTEGRIVAPPAVMAGTVYLGSRDGKLYALSLEDGSKQWDTEIGQGGIFSSPQLTKDRIYGGQEGAYYFVYALERAGGKDIWRRQSGELINRPPWVLADEARLYTHFDPPLNAPETVQVVLTALNPDTGENLWQTPLGAIPQVALALAGELLLVATNDQRLRAFDRTTGTLRWEAELAANPASAPLVQGSRVYLSTSEGFLYAFELATGKVGWRYQFPQTQLRGDLALSGKLLLIPGIQGLYTYDINALEPRWRYRTPSEITAPVASREHVYFGCANHLLYVLRVENGTVAGSYRTGDEILAPPVLAGGLVLVGASDGKLYAFEENAEAQQPRTQPRPSSRPGWLNRR
ncbi:MAG: PQQ-binding-like beta-propeller repeat protein [Candidatus Sericytochromatia bacterium]